MSRQFGFSFGWLFLFIGLAMHTQLRAEYQSHTSIKAAAEQHILERLQGQDMASAPRILFAELDQRLSLRECESPLKSYDPPSPRDLGRLSVGVRCDDNPGWSLFISAQVSADIPVVVSKQPLARNQILTADDVDIQVLASERLFGGYLQDINQVIGRKMRRDLNPGQALSPPMLIIPKAVGFGSLVTLVSKSGGFEIRMQGKALGAGGIGESVTVQNIKSKRKIAGIVLGQNLVEVR